MVNQRLKLDEQSGEKRALFKLSLALTIWPAISLALAGGVLTQSLLVGALGFIVGLSWGLLVTYAGRKLAQTSRRRAWGDGTLALAVVTSGVLLGGGLVYQLLVTAAAQQPETLPIILQNAIGGVLNMVFIVCNSAMEYILVPLVLLLNWRNPHRRRLLILAAVSYYLSRVWTYAYFAPAILAITASAHPGVPFPPEMIDRFRTWVNLDWGRNVFDLAVNVLLAGASLVSGQDRERRS